MKVRHLEIGDKFTLECILEKPPTNFGVWANIRGGHDIFLDSELEAQNVIKAPKPLKVGDICETKVNSFPLKGARILAIHDPYAWLISPDSKYWMSLLQELVLTNP